MAVALVASAANALVASAWSGKTRVPEMMIPVSNSVGQQGYFPSHSYPERLSYMIVNPSATDMKAYNFQVSGHPAQSLKGEAHKCMAKHTDLLGTIGAELAHLAERGINASSLDQLYWPRYLNSAQEDFNDSGNDRPFFQIHQGRLFAHNKSFRSKSRRKAWLEGASGEFVHHLCQLLQTYPGVPSMRLMANDHDHTENFENVPVFLPWKVKGSMPILYPQFTAEAIKEPVWFQKTPKAFFAGSPADQDSVFALTQNKRSQLQKRFDRDPVIRDLMSIHVSERLQHFYTKEEEASYKYQLVLDGTTAARGSFIAALSMHSLVLKPDSPYYEFFEPALVAYKHVVPVNLTDIESRAQDLQDTIHWARRHDAIAKEIAANGASFAKQHLRTSGVQCYFLELLLQYHDLLHFDDALPDEFASSPDLCSVTAQ